MIQFLLPELLEERDVSGYRLAKLAGLSLSTVYRHLHHAESDTLERLDLTTLDAICRVLHVQPGDLLRYIQEGKR